ncbi:MAG TPA: porin family protein [Acidobacteriota bacterium]
MKYPHFFLGAASLAALLVFAFQPGLGAEVGVLGGFTCSRFSSPGLSWTYDLGYSVGAFANLRWTRALRLQAELRFSSARSEAVIPIRYFSYRQDVKLGKTIQSVELPLMLHVYPFDWSIIRPNVQLGAYGAVNVHGQDRLDYQGASHTENIEDELHRFNAGFLVGVGIDFHEGRILWHLSVLWRIPLNPLAANDLGQRIDSTGFLISLGAGLWNPGGRAQ